MPCQTRHTCLPRDVTSWDLKLIPTNWLATPSHLVQPSLSSISNEIICKIMEAGCCRCQRRRKEKSGARKDTGIATTVGRSIYRHVLDVFIRFQDSPTRSR